MKKTVDLDTTQIFAARSIAYAIGRALAGEEIPAGLIENYSLIVGEPIAYRNQVVIPHQPFVLNTTGENQHGDKDPVQDPA